MIPQPHAMIRDAVLEDLPSIVEIYNSTIASRLVTADTEAVSIASRYPWFAAHSADRHPLWVLEQEQEICGWLSLSAFYGRPAYQATVEVSLYVAPRHRRQGVGQQLLRHTLTSSPHLGIESLLGFIFAHNQPSLNLFKQFGFQSWGYLPQVAKLDEIKRDLVILGLKIEVN